MTDLNNEGKPNDRSTFIKQYLERYEYCNQRQIGVPITVAIYPEELSAIGEAERKAKAWDELREWAGQGHISLKMDELLPPDPVDPLDELERWIHNIAGHPFYGMTARLGTSKLIDADGLLAKIKELKEKHR